MRRQNCSGGVFCTRVSEVDQRPASGLAAQRSIPLSHHLWQSNPGGGENVESSFDSDLSSLLSELSSLISAPGSSCVSLIQSSDWTRNAKIGGPTEFDTVYDLELFCKVKLLKLSCVNLAIQVPFSSRRGCANQYTPLFTKLKEGKVIRRSTTMPGKLPPTTREACNIYRMTWEKQFHFLSFYPASQYTCLYMKSTPPGNLNYVIHHVCRI